MHLKCGNEGTRGREQERKEREDSICSLAVPATIRFLTARDEKKVKTFRLSLIWAHRLNPLDALWPLLSFLRLLPAALRPPLSLGSNISPLAHLRWLLNERAGGQPQREPLPTSCVLPDIGYLTFSLVLWCLDLALCSTLQVFVPVSRSE